METLSKLGYYSGMYFPPALGTAETLFQTGSIQGFAYGSAFLLSLALAVFTLFLWQTGGGLARWFGVLCCGYALYMIMRIKAKIPRVIPVSETDLCVLLSNALENALHVCREQGDGGRAEVIEITVYEKKEIFSCR